MIRTTRIALRRISSIFGVALALFLVIAILTLPRDYAACIVLTIVTFGLCHTLFECLLDKLG
jgi:hypothetical protein